MHIQLKTAAASTMDLDARTKETAATLLGVATDYRPKEASDSSGSRHGWDVSTPSKRSPTNLNRNANGSSSHSSNNNANNNNSSNNNNNNNSSHHSPAFAAAAPAVPHSLQPQYPTTTSSTTTQQYSNMAAPAPAPLEDSSAGTVLSMSSIGFGIDSSASASWGDATDAAVRALQDAMERSTLQLPMVSSSQNLQIKVQIGVPPKQVGTSDPMVVDTARITSILPRAIPVLPIRIVVGGLFLPGQTQGVPSICTAIACITLSSQQAIPAHVYAPASASAQQQQQAATSTSPWASLEHSQPRHAHAHPHAQHAHPHAQHAHAQHAHAQHAHPPIPTSVEANIQPAAPPPPPPHAVAAAAAASAAVTALQYSSNANVHRSTSIEMLAMISAEMRSAGEQQQVQQQQQQQVQQQQQPAPSANYFSPSKQSSADQFNSEIASQDTNDSNEDMDVNGGNYNYKKLPPGTTTKNNRRLFVKHSYKDHSVEHATPEEQDLIPNNKLTTSAARTPNAAFPLKLHETLTQIETNGHGDIIGWMPHGRSFKIHKQKEFAEIILPKYFVMTKKSSFLRQLNLYGFNRFSAGHDQGSYYHEKFLRGLKFLCRRMTRRKVNGNRIRSAGNPDDEPVLAHYPECPPLGEGVGAGVGDAAGGSGGTPPSASSSRNDSLPLSSSPPNQGFACGAIKEEDADDDEETDDENDQGDEGDDADEDGQAAVLHRNNGGFQVSFPLKLQRMLDKLESERQYTDIISWLSHGRAFRVYQPEAFVDHLMPVYFNQTKFSSFQRQLHMYNFQRITAGRDKGAYHHAHFQRGKPHLCARMIRTRVNGKGCRKPGNPSNEPNLYSLEPLSLIEPGTSIEVPHGTPEGEDESDSVGS